MGALVETLKRLVEARGATGSEDEVRRVLESELKGYVDEVETDKFGNIIARKGSATNEFKILLTAHMDEPVLTVEHIGEDGLIRLGKIGALDDRVLLYQWIDIHTRGKSVSGVIAAATPELKEKEKIIKCDKLFVDVGVASRKEILELGVRVGDPVTFSRDMKQLVEGKTIMSRALDNRVGCLVLTEVMKAIADEKLNFTIYAAGTVQEEVGGRGAQIVASEVKPDVAIAADVATSTYPRDKARVRAGGGPTINTIAKSLMTGMWLFTPHRLRDFFITVAEEEGIPYQLAVELGGATDANYMQLRETGIASLAVLVPVKHVHTPAEIVELDDIENTVALLTAVLRRITPEILHT